MKNGIEAENFVVTEAEDWSWTFTDLPKYEAGEEITYTITEDALTDYSADINGYDVTNSYTPGKISIQVTKAWADKNDQDGKRIVYTVLEKSVNDYMTTITCSAESGFIITNVHEPVEIPETGEFSANSSWLGWLLMAAGVSLALTQKRKQEEEEN